MTRVDSRIVIDPRRIELADYADCHLAIRPGTNIALLNAMAHTIVVEGLTDRTFIEQGVSELDAFAPSIQRWTPERAAEICGVDADEIRRAARIYATQWRLPLPTSRGLNLLEMMDAAIDGRLKGLWAIGYDVLLTNPNATQTARALRSLDLVIVQDLFLTDTAREVASVFLPARPCGQPVRHRRPAGTCRRHDSPGTTLRHISAPGHRPQHGDGPPP